MWVARPWCVVLRALAPLPPLRFRAPPTPLAAIAARSEIDLDGGQGGFFGRRCALRACDRRNLRLAARGLLRLRFLPRWVRFLSGFRGSSARYGRATRAADSGARSSLARRPLLAGLRAASPRSDRQFLPLSTAARQGAPRGSGAARPRPPLAFGIPIRALGRVPCLGLRASPAAVCLGWRRCGGAFARADSRPSRLRALVALPARLRCGSRRFPLGLGLDQGLARAGLRACGRASALLGSASLPPRACGRCGGGAGLRRCGGA